MHQTRVVVVAVGLLLGMLSCDAASPEGDAPAVLAPPPAETPALGAAPSPASAPAPTALALFECSRDLERGFERITEVSRASTSSVIHVDTNYWGGASGGVAFGMSCLNDLCKQRGFTHYVLMSSRPIRYGTTQSPGNTWEATVGFLSSADQDVAASFPDLTEAGREYQAWPATGVEASSLPDFVGQVLPSDPWELFSSIHFRFRAHGEAPGDPLADEKELADRADKAERELAADPEVVWRRGEAAKTAAWAGRWESAESWARELLSSVEPSDRYHGQAVHDAHTTLGLIAMHEGDLDAAKIHLLKSGMTTGSPTLNSFGPNMSLARRLLEAGEREVVLEYFDQCQGFWKSDFGELSAWRAVVEQGGIPAFGANLIY